MSKQKIIEMEEVLREIINRPQWLGQLIAAKYLRGEDWKSHSEEIQLKNKPLEKS